jgi:hypothetical protein
MANKDIIQELNDLGSNLSKIDPRNPYSVPEQYFDGFAVHVMNLVKAGESLAWLSALPKLNPYHVPDGYFNGLDQRIMNSVRNHPDHQTSKEELESISPLLSSLSKRPVYAVPQGYFENFKIANEQTRVSKLVSLANRKWFRYAAAAIIIGVVASTGFFVYRNNHKDAASKTLAKFEKEVKRIDDVKKTDSLIDFMDAGLNQKELANNRPAVKTDDVQQLLQDVSTDELKDFNEQSRDIEDVMMTN